MLTPVSRLVRRYVFASTYPFPTFGKEEMGLMTWAEYLAFNNPQGKHHETGSYEYSLKDLNQETLHTVAFSRWHDWTVNTNSQKEYFVFSFEGRIAALLLRGILYYENPQLLKKVREVAWNADDKQPLEIKEERRVKYLLPLLAEVRDVTRKNLLGHKHVLQRFRVDNENYELRSTVVPRPDKGDTLVILNAKGEIVAMAMNEWGATLLAVVQEYRGKGLGEILGKYWKRLNPNFISGGYTPAGKANARRIWEARVQEFLSRGWYSELIRTGSLTKERVAKILSDLPANKRVPAPKPEVVQPKGVLVLVDDPTFVLYDEAFFETEDDQFIYGYGFFRDSHPVGTFLYTIDYEPKYKNLVTRVALQMAKDNNEDLYVGQGYGDLIEWEGVEGVESVEGQKIRVTRDVVPSLGSLVAKEKATRRKYDPHGEKYALLLEKAESKWL